MRYGAGRDSVGRAAAPWCQIGNLGVKDLCRGDEHFETVIGDRDDRRAQIHIDPPQGPALIGRCFGVDCTFFSHNAMGRSKWPKIPTIRLRPCSKAIMLTSKAGRLCVQFLNRMDCILHHDHCPPPPPVPKSRKRLTDRASSSSGSVAEVVVARRGSCGSFAPESPPLPEVLLGDGTCSA